MWNGFGNPRYREILSRDGSNREYFAITGRIPAYFRFHTRETWRENEFKNGKRNNPPRFALKLRLCLAPFNNAKRLITRKRRDDTALSGSVTRRSDHVFCAMRTAGARQDLTGLAGRFNSAFASRSGCKL
jgi:hypothetical protein